MGATAILQEAHLLGLRSRTAADLHERVLGGVPYAAFERFLKASGLSQAAALEVLQLAPSTLARRRHEGRLHPKESDRLARLARLVARATELFEGDRERAVRWLARAQRGLGGAEPLERAKTDAGAREIEELIARIEDGLVA